MVTMSNYEQCIFIIYDSASREKQKFFQRLIKINWTKFHFCNLTLIAYSVLTNKFTHQHFILKSFLNVNLYTWSAFISHAVCLGKLVNSLCKYSGFYLVTKNQWYIQNFQCVQNSILPNGKHIFPHSLANSYISFIMLSLKCEQPYVIYILCKLHHFQQLKLGHKFSQFIHRFKIGIIWVLVLDYTSKFFPIQKEILRLLNVVTAGFQFFSIHEKVEKLDFLNVSLGFTANYFPNHQRVDKLGFLNSHWFLILFDCGNSLLGTWCL